MGQRQVGKYHKRNTPGECPMTYSLLIYINDLPGDVAGLIKLFEADAKVYSTVETNQKEPALQNQVTN